MNPVVVIVGYNRIESIKRLMTSVQNAYYPVDDVTLVISLDYSDNTDQIVDALNEIGWSHGHLIYRQFNERQGLKKHILLCGDLTDEYDSVIVLEDDLFVSPNYYSYVLQMLDFYKNDSRICGISLYCHSWNGYGNYQFIPQRNEYDVFIGQIGVSWGQCWTKKQWNEFKKWYAKNKNITVFDNDLPWIINEWGDQSWAKYFYNYMCENNKYYVIPYISLSTNFSDTGEHNQVISNTYQVMILDAAEKQYSIPDFEDAIKYDMYFERIFDENTIINGVLGTEICVNLNGFRKDLNGKKYLLTSKRYEHIKKEASYGLRLRPVEQNVLMNIPGDDIFLYNFDQMKNVDISNYRVTPYSRIAYEIYGNPPKRMEEFCEYLKKNEIKKFDYIDISINAWEEKKNFDNIQKVLQYKLNCMDNTGYTWMFHCIIENEDEWNEPEYSITAHSFIQLIKKYISDGYNFKEVNQIFQGTKNNNVFITFDDGYKGVYEYVYPICQKYQIPFCVFITIEYIDKKGYLGRDQLIELSNCKLCTIGAHTISHPKLRYLNDEDISKEVVESKRLLEKIINKNVDVFAYPYGSVYAVDNRSIEAVKNAGYNIAFSTLKSHNVNLEEARFFLPRININEKVAKVMMMDIN